MSFRESSAKDLRTPARKRRLRLQGEVLFERRACQYTDLVLKSCDFKLELRGLAVGTAEVRFLYWY